MKSDAPPPTKRGPRRGRRAVKPCQLSMRSKPAIPLSASSCRWAADVAPDDHLDRCANSGILIQQLSYNISKLNPATGL